MAVSNWLEAAGLQRYVGNFAGVSEETFLSLLMQDYSKYGVVSMEDKQKLFRLIKNINKDYAERHDRPAPAAQGGGKPSLSQLELQGHQLDGNAALLDLDANDGDLLSHAPVPAFQLSPLGGRQKNEAVPPLTSDGEPEDPPKIRVVVRKRPINKKEKERGEDDIVDVHNGRAYVIVNETKVKVDLTKYIEKHQFNFDDALDEVVSNDQVYRTTVQPLVHTLFKNGRATCFAYGQTGSGKTFTMSPLPTRAAADIIEYLRRPTHSGITLHVALFEIYGNKVFDLLNSRKRLNILEDGKKKVVVVGLKEYCVQNVETVAQLIEIGNKQRSTGSTAANADSSRSHSIMQFCLKKEDKLVGKISFIDLAGSERGADTFDNDRQTRLEGAEINKSLLALKECIRALDSDARHVPFRGSKLTAVLRDSFVGGQARTVMIANISPNSASVEHTLNTLRYADRVKELRKDKGDRAPGGVTPGDQQYYAAAARGVEVEEPRHKSPSKPPPVVYQPPPAPAYKEEPPIYKENSSPDDELFFAQNELMSTILEEEEELITAHRLQIEETMDIVRKEMNLLTEVDQPGSAIDQYVGKLEYILAQKAQGIAALQRKLEGFKHKLKQEEEMAQKTIGKKWKGR